VGRFPTSVMFTVPVPPVAVKGTDPYGTPAVPAASVVGLMDSVFVVDVATVKVTLTLPTQAFESVAETTSGKPPA
jgi:hypothetical protein